MRTKLINIVGNFKQTVSVPLTDKDAATFATNYLEGETKILKETSGFPTGAKALVAYRLVKVTIVGLAGKDKVKTTFTMPCLLTSTDDAIEAALKGKTINGMVVSDVYLSGYKVDK
jgi:hypothetical protein